MTVGQKASISLLVSTILAAIFAVLAFSGLFSVIESDFFDARVRRSVDTSMDAMASSVDEYHQVVFERFQAVVGRGFMRRSFLPNQSAGDLFDRSNALGVLVEETPGLLGVRFIDNDGRRIHFSTFQSDILRSEAQRLIYRNYGEPSDEAFALLAVSEDSSPIVGVLPDRRAFAYRFPFVDDFDVFRGSAVFYVSFSGVLEHLIRDRMIGLGDDIMPVGNGILFGAPAWGGEELLSRVDQVWSGITSFDPIPIGSAATSGSFILFSRMGLGGMLGRIVPADWFVFPEAMRWLLLVAVFVTVYLLSFLLLNLRQDRMVVLSSRIKRFQFAFLEEYLERKSDLDLDRWKRELEARRSEVRDRIKQSAGRLAKKREAEVDELIDRSWDEIINVLSARGERGDSLDLTKIETLLKEALSKGTFVVQAGAGTIPAKPSVSQPLAAIPASTTGSDEVEEAEELEEAEALEEFEELTEAEALEEAETVAEAEPEDMEELAGSGEVEEATELEEAEVLEEPEELEELEELTEAEELEEAETVAEAEELEEAETLAEPEPEPEPDDIEELAGSGEEEEATELEEAEVLEEVEELEELTEAEELEEAETVAEAEVEAEADEMEELAESGEEEEATELEEAEELEELEELEEFEEGEELDVLEEHAASESPRSIEDMESLRDMLQQDQGSWGSLSAEALALASEDEDDLPLIPDALGLELVEETNLADIIGYLTPRPENERSEDKSDDGSDTMLGSLATLNVTEATDSPEPESDDINEAEDEVLANLVLSSPLDRSDEDLEYLVAVDDDLEDYGSIDFSGRLASSEEEEEVDAQLEDVEFSVFLSSLDLSGLEGYNDEEGFLELDEIAAYFGTDTETPTYDDTEELPAEGVPMLSDDDRERLEDLQVVIDEGEEPVDIIELEPEARVFRRYQPVQRPDYRWMGGLDVLESIGDSEPFDLLALEPLSDQEETDDPDEMTESEAANGSSAIVIVDGVFTLNRDGMIPADSYDPELKSLADAVLGVDPTEAREE